MIRASKHIFLRVFAVPSWISLITLFSYGSGVHHSSHHSSHHSGHRGSLHHGAHHGFHHYGFSRYRDYGYYYPVTQNTTIRSKGGSGFTYRKSIGSKGKGLGQFIQPVSIAFATDGSFVVTDSGNSRVQQFYPDGRAWREWSVSGDGKTLLVNPVGLAIGVEGDIWVSDYDLGTVNHYLSDGTPQGMFGESRIKAEKLDAPSGLAIMSDGTIAVSDFSNHRIQIFSPGGSYLRSIGAKGMFRRLRTNGLNHPTRIKVSLDGILWVSDAHNHRVVAFDSNGKLIRRFGKKGHRPGQFEVSSGIALLPNNRLAIGDFMNHRVQIWTRDGEFIGDLGSQGSSPSQFERPSDAALSSKGELYVVDRGNNRIQVFSEGGEEQEILGSPYK